jgi:hypothetical protein
MEGPDLTAIRQIAHELLKTLKPGYQKKPTARCGDFRPGASESECAMQNTPKIPGDRLVLGMISVFRTLVVELSKNGVIDLDEFVTTVQETAVAHRETGDPNNLADAIHAISIHLGSVPDPQN